ncbi:GNAT family N-acetyltransferase [Actinomadura fibrosa]|uniref:GNAT family N-acetyltransferase n=1 Tax=Actinomadura fibrosa TaxID=111802 RepID=A0ABW2XHF4_9ACTN|nr:GNAT family N-acetyltransferase [Actinomadura fibrosa]
MNGTVRRLGPDDMAACRRLAVGRDWGPEEHKWGLLFAIGAVYGLDAPDGDGLAGTVVATPYGRDVAAISMVLVAERYERQGLGGRLMRHAIEHTDTASFCLTATPYGRPLYERLGFRSLCRCTTYTGVAHGLPDGSASAPAEPADLPDILALDTDVFGAPRTALIERLPSFCERFRVVRDAAGLRGFAGAWRNDETVVVGPVIARDPKTALTLVEETAPPGEKLRLDIDHRHPELFAWAEDHGLRPAFSTTIMEYGAPVRNDPERLFLPVAQALG